MGRGCRNQWRRICRYDVSSKINFSKDFEDWVAEVKKSALHLTEDDYNELVKPSVNKSIILFSEVEKDLYHKIIHKYMYPTKPVL